MAPFPMPDQNTILSCIEDLRIFLCQPCRGRCGRGAEYDFHIFLSAKLQKRIVKIKYILTFTRLKFIPCKFCNPNYINPGFFHSA